MEYEDWKKYIIEYMTNKGWTNDRDDDSTLGFSFPEGEKLWIRDYDKTTRRFIQFDGNLRIKIKVNT